MDWAKVKNMSKEERLCALATRSDEEHRRDFLALADLGARLLPKTVDEWVDFDAVEHELVAFKRLAKPIHERLRGRTWG